MACRPSPLPHAPHPHLHLLAQPGRAVVRAADRQETAPRSTPVHPGPGERHSRLDHQLERQTETLRLDQDRRRDPRTPRLIYSTDPWRRTLGASSANSSIAAVWSLSSRILTLPVRLSANQAAVAMPSLVAPFEAS